MKKKDNINKRGFTLAEVLITLSIIGVIAAILFPSILANYNERTLKAKRQALFGRMSQAMGEMSDTFRNYADVTCTNTSDPTTCTDIGSAAKFVNEGLSKVYKISAVCDNDSLSACDIPEEVTRANGTTFSLKDNGISLTAYNSQVEKNGTSYPYDTNSVGLMTKNGESILLFYNPNCQGKVTYTDANIYGEQSYCVNMIYDLNGGKKKPNKVGEDIGFISVFYNDQPYVATARPLDWRSVPDFETTTNSSGEEVFYKALYGISQAEAQAACNALGDNVGLPSLEEGMTLQLNRELWAPREEFDLTGATRPYGLWFWTSTKTAPNKAWMYHFRPKNYTGGNFLYINQSTTNAQTDTAARCVYKD